MRHSIWFISLLSLLHAIDLCMCEEDEVTLLQLKTVTSVQAQLLPRTGSSNARSLLESVRQMAHQLTNESPEVANAAIESVRDALAQMEPLIIEEHDQVQASIMHQLEEIQACHSSSEHGATVVSQLGDDLTGIRQCRDAVNAAVQTQQEMCDLWHNHAEQVVFPPCLSASGAEQVYSVATNLHHWVADAWPIMDSMRSRCIEATDFANAESARCQPLLDAYDETFCQHSLSCRLLDACHDHELAVYDTLREDSLQGQSSRQSQWSMIQQAECILDMLMGGLDTNETVSDSSLSSCDDGIDVSHLILSFPEPGSGPQCPIANVGDPQCPDVPLPDGWTGGSGTFTGPPTLTRSDAVGGHNLAMWSVADPFGSKSWGNGCSTPEGGTKSGVLNAGRNPSGPHCWANINDGLKDEQHSWMPGTEGWNGLHYVGVIFTRQWNGLHYVDAGTQTIGAFSLSDCARIAPDYTRVYSGRAAGDYEFQYTEADIDWYSQSEWSSAGTFTITHDNVFQVGFQLSRPVQAKAVRVLFQSSRPDMLCISELEVYGPQQ